MTPLLAVFRMVLFMLVPRGPPVRYCVLCHSEGAFHCNTRFVITLISLGSQDERYDEVSVYFILRGPGADL